MGTVKEWGAGITEKQEMEAEIQSLREENLWLQQRVKQLEKIVFGPRSEKNACQKMAEGEQSCLFDEAENTASEGEREAEKAVVVPAHTRKPRRTHEEIMAALPVEEVVHEAADKICSVCGSEMEVVGKEFVRDELIYEPARLFVRKHYVEVLKCPVCEQDPEKDLIPHFQKAAAPAPLIPHSFASGELVAHILYEKYVMGTPLHRLEKDFAAKGIRLSKATMANWCIWFAENKAAPVWQQLKKDLLAKPVLHADETVVQVLREPGRKAAAQSRMWAYCSTADSGKQQVLYEYHETRNGQHAVDFLGNYSGYVICDGFDGYNKLPSARRCGCWVHLRRKFIAALPPDKKLQASSKAAEGAAWCDRLFHLEKQFADLSPEERQKQRQEQSKPVLDGFFAWVYSFEASTGSALYRAVQYARNEKPYLCAFLNDPAIPIHNNQVENAIRPFVIGRKNWLFSCTPKGAKASAVIYSLAVSANANGLLVEEYFNKLLASRSMLLPY